MAYHISYCWYEKIERVPNYLFLGRFKEWNYDTLVTRKDFDDACKLEESEKRKLERLVSWHPTIDHESIYRQYRLDESPAQSRLMVSFAYTVNELHLKTLKSRGFKISNTPINYMGHEGTRLVIIAEECVNMQDALEWASKFDLRNYQVSTLEPPICFQPTIKLNKYDGKGTVKDFDSREIIEYCVENGLEKAQEHFGYDCDSYNMRGLLHRVECIKNNTKFIE